MIENFSVLTYSREIGYALAQVFDQQQLLQEKSLDPDNWINVF